jgi:hypothetical protein
MRKGVGRQQKAEIIRDEWTGYGAQGKQGNAQEKGCEADDGDRQALPPRQTRQWALNAREE